MKEDRSAVLSAVALFLVAALWAALHDISRGAEQDFSLEYFIVAISLPALAWIYTMVMPALSARRRVRWLGIAGTILLLFNLAAVSARLNPKYPNDAEVGMGFLAIGIPVLAFVAIQFSKAQRASRS